MSRGLEMVIFKLQWENRVKEQKEIRQRGRHLNSWSAIHTHFTGRSLLSKLHFLLNLHATTSCSLTYAQVWSLSLQPFNSLSFTLLFVICTVALRQKPTIKASKRIRLRVITVFHHKNKYIYCLLTYTDVHTHISCYFGHLGMGRTVLLSWKCDQHASSNP